MKNKPEIKDEERMATIPLISHQLDMARLERVIRWLVAIIVALIVVIGIGVYEFTCCDFADVVIDSDDGGAANYLKAGANGVINNAKDHSPGTDAQED